MPNRIKEDHNRFRKIISGRAREELKKFIKKGSIVRQRPDGGTLTIPFPQIDIPHFLHGDNGEGIGRGPGKEGDVVGRDPQPGQNGAGNDDGEGIRISIDLEEVYKFMEEDLKLPHMKPKPNETFEDVKTKYTNISRVGLNSLRHIRRTMKETIKRMAITGQLDTATPSFNSVRLTKKLLPHKADFRFRQFKQYKIPSSNAVIFFARDCSGSMNDYRCDIVSDMAWWIDCWIKRFYKKVDRCYFVHDTRAIEVNEQEFYSTRFMGGTNCSTAFEAIADKLENRFNPDKYNVYIFYFTDGDNWEDDNLKLLDVLRTKLGPDKANLIGISQICADKYDGSVKELIDEAIRDGILDKHQINTVSVGTSMSMPEETRNNEIIDGIKKILTVKEKK